MPEELPVAQAAHRRLAVGAACALVGVAASRWPSALREGGLQHLMLPEELALGLGAVGLLLAGAPALLRHRPGRVEALAAALLALGLVSAALAPNGWLALRSLGLWLGGLVVFGVARAAARAGGAPPPLAPLLWPVGLVALSVVLEAAGALPRLSGRGHAPGGLLGERNIAAQFLLLGAPAAAHVAVCAGRRSARLLGYAVALGCAAGVVACRTRSAWLAGAALLLLGAFFAARSGAPARRRAALVAAVLAAGAALGPALGARLSWSTATPYRDTLARLVSPSSPSARGRLVQYATSLRLAAAHPLLGVGPGNWAGQYPAFAGPKDPTVTDGPWPTPRLPNSDLLGHLAEHGALSLALALALGWALARERGPRARLRRATLLALAMVCALDAVLTVPAPLWLAAWVLGASAEPQVAGRSPAAVRWAAAAGVAAAALLLSGSAALAARRLAAFDAWAQQRDLDALERAVRLDPGDLAARLLLAANLVALQRCADAAPHLQVLARQAPVWPAADELRAACR